MVPAGRRHSDDAGAGPCNPAPRERSGCGVVRARRVRARRLQRPARAVPPRRLKENVHLFPLRDACLYDELTQVQAAWGNTSTPNPPYGAVFTYNVVQAPAGEAKLWLNITDDAGRAVRRMEVPNEPGLHRVAWNLRGEPPAQPAGETGGRGGRGEAVAGWRGRRSGAAGAGRRSRGPVAGAGGCRGPVSRDARDSQRREPYGHRAAPNLCRCAAATLMSYIARPAVLKLKGFGRRLSRESRPAIPSAGGTISPPGARVRFFRDAPRAWFFGLSCGYGVGIA